jgi:hypothetical protein
MKPQNGSSCQSNSCGGAARIRIGAGAPSRRWSRRGACGSVVAVALWATRACACHPCSPEHIPVRRTATQLQAHSGTKRVHTCGSVVAVALWATRACARHPCSPEHKPVRRTATQLQRTSPVARRNVLRARRRNRDLPASRRSWWRVARFSQTRRTPRGRRFHYRRQTPAAA